MNQLASLFKRLTVLFFILILATGCIAVKKSVKNKSNCPVDSEFYWIEVDEKYDNCLISNRDFYCEKWIGGGNYGFTPEYYYEALKSYKKDTFKSIIVLNPSDLNGISNFVNLEYLMIYEIETLPKEISELKKLKILYIVNYNATEISKYISQLKTIEVLSLGRCSFLKDFDEGLYNLANLRELYIRRTRYKFETRIDFGRFKKLERVIFNDNIEPLINKTIVNCKSVNYISSLEVNSYYEHLKNLIVLSVEHVNSKNELECLPKLKKLEELFIGSYSIDGISELITKIPKLKNLDIDFSYSKTSICGSTPNFKSLEYLRISSYNLDCFPYFEMPKIKYINLGNRGENKLNEIDYNRLNGYKHLLVIDIAGSGFKNFDISRDSIRAELFNPWQ